MIYGFDTDRCFWCFFVRWGDPEYMELLELAALIVQTHWRERARSRALGQDMPVWGDGDPPLFDSSDVLANARRAMEEEQLLSQEEYEDFFGQQSDALEDWDEQELEDFATREACKWRLHQELFV